MKDKNEIFVTNLKKYLRSKGVAQNTFADEMGVSEATVSEWVNGKKYPRSNRINHMAEYFCCTVSDLTAYCEGQYTVRDDICDNLDRIRDTLDNRTSSEQRLLLQVLRMC